MSLTTYKQEESNPANTIIGLLYCILNIILLLFPFYFKIVYPSYQTCLFCIHGIEYAKSWQ